MLITNLTIAGLLLSASTSRSPFLSVHPMKQPISNLFITKSSLINHFSTFLKIASEHSSTVIRGSNFKGFLSSVIDISKEAPEQVVKTASFDISGSSFIGNKTPFNGACILTSSESNIEGNISNTVFSSNQAGIGGAIYFYTVEGTLNITKCTFSYNKADIGSHAFISVPKYISTNNKYMFGTGKSGLLFLAKTQINYTFHNDNYYQNEGTVNFTGEADAQCVISYYNSNFMKFTENDPLNFTEKTFFYTEKAKKVEFTNCQFNDKFLESGKIDFTDNFAIKLNETGYNTTNPEKIRLIPTQSPTLDADWKSTPAIFSISCLAFFFVVSIIGIVIVSCSNKGYDPANNGDLLKQKEEEKLDVEP